MPLLSLSHVTQYTYRQPVAFGEHRIMVRPRESYDQHLVEATLDIDPPPSDLRWLQDVFGNSVAIATFKKRAKSLTIDSKVRVRHNPAPLQNVDIEDYARFYPFTYSSEEMPDLLRSIERQHLDPLRQIDHWARSFLDAGGRTDTLAMLSSMTASIKRDFTYVSRPEKGTQTPIETLTSRKGTCRDYAMLMIEAARALGFAARFVSGYVYSPTTRDTHVGGGNTHAWVRIYLPGSGWVEFDPTNGIIGNRGLIRVAVARDIYQAVPISGTWAGFPGSFLDMTVGVNISVEDPAAESYPQSRSI
ncbi:transglutaminase family protein [Sphingomonas glacialis]|uniref:Transglutaminase family protein n=1 Tax=Sphingomonas glacialis TaxID=658225 RepID=A0A502FRF5_9SPHN|nr:transglutaminase family protein [Sphingomonas glacialis]TPG52014.1 transglutaminase family protein [Sphingomonas glacialis]